MRYQVPLLLIASLLAGFVLSCRQKNPKHPAHLQALTDTTTKKASQYEGLKAGGEDLKQKKTVRYEQVTCKWLQSEAGEGYLQVRLSDSTGFVRGTTAALNLPASWKHFSTLKGQFFNPTTETITLVLKISAPRGVMPDTTVLPANQEKSVAMPLYDLPLIAGNKPPYKPNAVVIEASGKPGAEIQVTNLALEKTGEKTPKPIGDRFGQRIRGDWESKVENLNDLEETKKAELKNLQNMSAPKGRDAYWGLKNSMQFEKTGFFYVTNVSANGKKQWWLVTPEGNPFWSLGVTCIRPKKAGAAVTPLKNRRFLFKQLPDPDGPYSDAYLNEDYFSFYNWNILRKYGNYEDWRNRVFLRLEKWGLNSIGNWTSEIIMKDSKFPYTRSYNTDDVDSLTIGHGLCDVFSQAWVQHVDEVLAQTRAHKNDRMLLGYFVDNEAGWRNPELLKIAPANSATRQHWLKQTKETYASLKAVNEAWNTRFNTWQEVKTLHADSIKVNEALAKAIKQLERDFANQYFRVIHNTLERYDPNHMYLGARFTKRPLPGHILKQSAEYCDVITVNVYDLVPQKERMQTWYERAGRPVLIGEHHLPLKSERQLPPHWKRFTKKERHKYYKEYVKTWANMPFSVGCHWYQFADQHITGRAGDGENQNIGLVDIADQPYPHMVKAIQDASKHMYQWHKNSAK